MVDGRWSMVDHRPSTIDHRPKGGAMAFDERRAALAADLARLEDLARQARDVATGLDARAEAAEGETETFADDTALARVRATAKRARQDLGALARTLRETRNVVTSD